MVLSKLFRKGDSQLPGVAPDAPSRHGERRGIQGNDHGRNKRTACMIAPREVRTLNLLEELESLGAQIEQAGDLETLKTIFYRLDEIAQQYPSDFDIQLAARDLRQRLLDCGNRLRAAQTEGERPPQPPAKPPTTSRRPPVVWRRWIAAAVALAVLIGGGVTIARKRKAQLAALAVPLEIVTVPPGAAVSINGEAQCTSNCRLTLPAGNYQVIAMLNGFESAQGDVVLLPGKPASLIFPLAVHARLRILSDLDQGSVELDDEPLADLVEGQFVLDRVTPGVHVLKVAGKNGAASVPFEITADRQPSLTGTPITRNLAAVAVASLGNQARLFASSGGLRLTVNGQPQEDAGPAGADLTNFQAGLNEIRIGEGKDQRIVKQDFGVEPMLTVFLKSEVNLGTLIVSTAEDDVRVFVNGKEYPRKTLHGQIRIPTIGNVNVRVAKGGFDEPAPMTAEVKKGTETRLEFVLRKTPVAATLRIAGGTPGAEVLIDERTVGVIDSDGVLSRQAVSPGDHTIELRKDQYVAKRYQRSFQTGQTVTISGAELLAVEILPPPPPEKNAPSLVKEIARPVPAQGTIADFADPSQWHEENGEFVHHGAAFLPYKLPPAGIFTFTVELLKGGGLFRSGKVRWRLMYIDNRNYAEFEIDRGHFVSRVVRNGKAFERGKKAVKDWEKQKQVAILIDVSSDHIVHKLGSAGAWVPLDAWSEPGVRFSDGKFGFLVQGSEEIGLQDFRFQPQ